MSLFPEELWIVKPPNTNNGRGVRVIKDIQDLPDAKDPAFNCVQKYIRRPFLIRGSKVYMIILISILFFLKQVGVAGSLECWLSHLGVAGSSPVVTTCESHWGNKRPL